MPGRSPAGDLLRSLLNALESPSPLRLVRSSEKPPLLNFLSWPLAVLSANSAQLSTSLQQASVITNKAQHLLSLLPDCFKHMSHCNGEHCKISMYATMGGTSPLLVNEIDGGIHFGGSLIARDQTLCMMQQ